MNMGKDDRGNFGEENIYSNDLKNNQFSGMTIMTNDVVDKITGSVQRSKRWSDTEVPATFDQDGLELFSSPLSEEGNT